MHFAKLHVLAGGVRHKPKWFLRRQPPVHCLKHLALTKNSLNTNRSHVQFVYLSLQQKSWSLGGNKSLKRPNPNVELWSLTWILHSHALQHLKRPKRKANVRIQHRHSVSLRFSQILRWDHDLFRPEPSPGKANCKRLSSIMRRLPSARSHVHTNHRSIVQHMHPHSVIRRMLHSLWHTKPRQILRRRLAVRCRRYPCQNNHRSHRNRLHKWKLAWPCNRRARSSDEVSQWSRPKQWIVKSDFNYTFAHITTQTVKADVWIQHRNTGTTCLLISICIFQQFLSTQARTQICNI